jgi:hypothetical protein
MSVYFVTCREAGAVKIGHSVDPYGRLPEIQMGCPLPLKLEATLPGAREQEGAMHWRFSEHRIHGEWFTLAAEIELVITANPAPPPPERGPKGGTPGRTNTPIKDARVAKRELRAPPPLHDLQAGKRYLIKREAAGDICFPFRVKEDA